MQVMEAAALMHHKMSGTLKKSMVGRPTGNLGMRCIKLLAVYLYVLRFCTA